MIEKIKRWSAIKPFLKTYIYILIGNEIKEKEIDKSDSKQQELK